MKEQIKELRVEIDGLSVLTKQLSPSKEIEKTYDSLIFAKAWLGKVLGEIGEPTPYANDGNRKSVQDIEQTADTSNKPKDGSSFEENWSNKNHIEKVDWLRQEINKITVEVQSQINRFKFGKIQLETYSSVDLYQQNIYTYLCEARFWLGFELQRIKENS